MKETKEPKFRRIYKMTEEQRAYLLKINDLYTTEELCEMFNVDNKYLNYVRRQFGISKFSYLKDIPEGYRKCGNCGEILLEDSFCVKYKNDPSRGRYSHCKDCVRIKKSIQYKDRMIIKKAKKLEEFKLAYADKKLLCKKCKQEYKLNGFEVFPSKNGKVTIQCKKCNCQRTV